MLQKKYILKQLWSIKINKRKGKNMINIFKKTRKNSNGITLIALVITIQVNCSCVAMEQMLKNVNSIEKIKDL